MKITENIRLNRTKMLDEAAINHRPTHFVHSLLIFFLVYSIATMASTIIVTLPTLVYLMTNDSFWSLMTGIIDGSVPMEELDAVASEVILNVPSWLMIISLISAGACFILASIIYCKFIEKRPIKTLGLRKTNYALEYGAGALIGVVMYALTVLVAFLCGSIEVVKSTNFSAVIILFLIAFVIQGAGEELLVRGYLMTTVARDYKVGLALAFSSAVFALMHGSNTGVGAIALINIFLFGVFEGIYILKRGDIIGACAIHTMWNFTQGCVFGSSVSGMSSMPAIFNTVINEDMKAANGGAFGLEGGFSATIVILIAIGAVLLLKPKQSELPLYELNRDSSSNEENIDFN